MKQEEAEAIFTLAGIPVKKVYETVNGYWPPAYIEQRAAHPWWLVNTKYGLIRIGWRKRVINIDWGDTDYRLEVTDDEVTKDADYVHAWSYAKAVEYLNAFRIAADEVDRENDRENDK